MSKDALRLHLFSDNKVLDEERFNRMLPGIAAIERVHWRTRDYINEQQLDEDVFLPGNVWAHICKLDSFRKWTYELASICKVLAPFTGHYMALWGRVDLGHVEEAQVNRFYRDLFERGVPADLDTVLSVEYGLVDRIKAYLDDLVLSYDRLVDSVSSRFHVQTPRCNGEIGVLHRGNLVNFDVVTYQGRVNALVGGGVLEHLCKRCDNGARVNVLEIGPGHCYMAYALHQVLKGRSTFYLVDLARSLVDGFVYLSGIFGPENIQLVTEETTQLEDKPFVLIPNYLLPMVEAHLSEIDLFMNAISLNEMSEAQNRYYLDFISNHSSEESTFYMEGGGCYIEEHTDALSLAKKQFPKNTTYLEHIVGESAVHARPNSFFKVGF